MDQTLPNMTPHIKGRLPRILPKYSKLVHFVEISEFLSAAGENLD